jgi:hypothetical protein
LKAGLSVSTIAAAPAAIPADANPAHPRKQPRLLFYHDGRHPLIYMYEPPIQKEQYEAAVDELAGTPVEAIMFCLGDGRTVLHDTKVGELWGHNVDKWPHIIFRRAHQNAKHLIDTGNDPLRIVCDRAHEKGMLFYPTLLVQQGTRDRAVDVRASEFRFNNRHLEMGAGGDLDADHPCASCLDFKHAEVREERLALIKETVDKYPVDGFELQLNYQAYYFHPAEVMAGQAIMTEWIREVRRTLTESGANRELVIRVPADVEGCESVGLDVRQWIAEGLVDVVVGETLGGPELLDHTSNLRPLVEAAEGKPTRVHAALHALVDSDRLHQATNEMLRAAASNYWAQGVDGLYLAYWFGYWPYKAPFYEILREALHPDVMEPKDKTYYIPTATGRYPEPRLEPGLKMQLPADLHPNQPVRLQLPISDDLPHWNRTGRVHQVLLRCRVMNTTELDRLEFRLNGKQLPDELRRTINEMYRMSAPRYRTGSGYWFIFKLDREHWPRQGKNTIEITLGKRDPDVTPEVFLRDVELEVQYLLGKNFHRGQDIELGPFDHAMF